MNMNDILFALIYCGLVGMTLMTAYFALCVPRKKINLCALYRNTSVVRKQRKTKVRKPKKKIVKRIIVIEHKGDIEE